MMKWDCFLPLKTRKAPEIKDFCVRVQNCCTDMAHSTKMQLVKSRRRRVYHQFRKELHIIKAERFVYHHCES